jgi:Cu+-exporting ATPase
MKKKIKKQHKKKQKENILTAVTTTGGAGNKANDYIEVGNNNNNNDDDDDDIARKSLSIDNVNTIGITSSNSFNGRATIEIFYDSNKIGIRTILSQIQSNPKLESQSGCCTGTIDVTDISSYQTMIAKAEARRKAEITQYFHSFLIAACCAIPVFLVSMVFVHVPGMKASLHSYIFWHITWEEMIAWVLTTPVQFYSGARFYREAYYSIKTRHLGMGFLIASGTSAAYFYSVFVVFYNATRNAMMGDRLMQAFETSALLIMFVLLGKWLECKVKSFTSNAISKLSRLAPETATLVGVVNDDNKGSTNVNNYDPIPEEQIPLILLQKNDVLLVRPGEKVPTDGVVIQGSSSIDESMLTGESMPVHKENQCLVIGGTINIDGAIYIQVNAIGKDTALSKIIELIESAQSSKAPIQEYADRIASKFVPLVTGIALFTYVIWAALLNSGALNGVKDTWPYKEEGLNDWTLPLLFSISCLVIACPCALGLATPTALMVGSGISAKHGVLIKGGEALETTSKLTAIVFDKTGTLTYGKPVVKEILLLSDRMAFLSLIQQEFEENEVHDVAQINERALRTILTFAACAECGSEHPLAKGELISLVYFLLMSSGDAQLALDLKRNNFKGI